MVPEKLNFIVIDDSQLDCFIAGKIISKSRKSDSVKTFSEATEALDYIKKNPDNNDKTIILVDIQMPVMNGFEFVEAIEQLPKETVAHYVIFILSSSINENDLNRVRSYPSVKQFINKPLTSKSVLTILEAVSSPAR